MTTSFLPAESSIGVKHATSWHHTALRITKPAISVEFYKKHFGMTLVHEFTCENLTVYYLATLREGQTAPKAGTPEAEKFTMNFEGTLLALGREDETPEDQKMNNGNEEPHRGFGHIAFNCNDVYESSKKLEANGVAFRKRPDEGRMKGLAFALDPDGYWIEIVGRGESQMPEEYNFSQTMIRIKDPKVSIPFYRDVLGMTVVREMHMSDFSNFFLASLPKDTKPPVGADHADAKHFVHELWNPCLELTWNHGTEKDENFSYHSGNTDPIGFSHLAFLVDDVKAFCDDQDEDQKKRGIEVEENGFMATLQDPNGYRIRAFNRGKSSGKHE